MWSAGSPFPVRKGVCPFSSLEGYGVVAEEGRGSARGEDTSVKAARMSACATSEARLWKGSR